MSEKRLESITVAELQDVSSESLRDLDSAATRMEMERWLTTILSVQQSALGQADFFQSAAAAMVDLIGLDEGMVILSQSDEMEIVASSSREEMGRETFNRSVVERVFGDKQTYFESDAVGSEAAISEAASSDDAQASVAAPIIDTTDRVVGVLYGVRQSGTGQPEPGVQRLEALMVTLIAGVVSAGLIRQDRQAEASRFQMQLEQFASPKLVQAMKHDPEILEAREREITVLFSDIRGFTGLTERVGAEKTFTMIRNLMNQLTGCILDEEGFIMGYAGDGIAAMWNAPTDQPDHAELACWAAVNMQKVMSKLSQFWNFVTGEQLAARIGICTGLAHVGNSGSRWRLNYSALGPCVNLASRLEGANKFFGTSILMAESTKTRLFSKFDVRRIGPVVVKGFNQVTEVYELIGETGNNQLDSNDEYESALRLFEDRKYDQALSMISKMTERGGAIDPALGLLRSQIESSCSADDGTRQPAIRLGEK